MKKTLLTKLMIIENFIDHYTTNDVEREEMKDAAYQYVVEDHVDEVAEAFPPIEDEKPDFTLLLNVVGSFEQGVKITKKDITPKDLVDGLQSGKYSVCRFSNTVRDKPYENIVARFVGKELQCYGWYECTEFEIKEEKKGG